MSFNCLGELEEVIFEARLMRKLDTSDFSEDAEFINGLQSHEVEIQRHVPLHKAKVWIRRSKDKKTLVISAIEIPYSCALFQRESTLPWLCWPTEKDEYGFNDTTMPYMNRDICSHFYRYLNKKWRYSSICCIEKVYSIPDLTCSSVFLQSD